MYLNSAWINLTRASIKLDENQQEIITETELDDDDIIILCLVIQIIKQLFLSFIY